jgi:hypothetical protein
MSPGSVRTYSHHGKTKTAEYNAWRGMRGRCTNPRNPVYRYYGGRGITVCERWINDPAAFLADMGPKPSPKHQLDRCDNSKGYSPENCRWATVSENTRNRRTNRWVKCLGKDMTLAEAAELSGLSSFLIRSRLNAGWDPDLAVSIPSRQRGPRLKVRWLEVNGSRITFSDAASTYGIARSTLANRLSRGWGALEALTTPVQPTNKQKKETECLKD